MTWPDRLRAELDRDAIPQYLADLQLLVAALREGRRWEPLLSPRLRQHAALTVAYLQAGPKRDAVARELGLS